MYRWLGVLVLTAMMGAMSAQASADDHGSAVPGLAELEERIEHLKELRAAADAAQEWDRDGFHFRLDQVNLTASRARRIELEIACGPNNDLDAVEKSLYEFLAEHPQILNKPKPEVFLARVGSSERAFIIRPWVRTENYWSIQHSLLKDIHKRLERDGITRT